jgi:hypothetical protein
MPRGSRPGERRGGRKKGTPNKLTREKIRRAIEAVDRDGGSSAVDMLDRGMKRSFAWAEACASGEMHDDKLHIQYLRMATDAARALAPYQSPTLATVRIGESRDNPLEIREGVTSTEIRAELIAMMTQSGIVPTKLIGGGLDCGEVADGKASA